MISDEIKHIRHYLENELNTNQRIFLSSYDGIALIESLNKITVKVEALEKNIKPTNDTEPESKGKVIQFNLHKRARGK